MNIPAHIKEVVLSLYSIEYLLKCRVSGMDGNRLLAAPARWICSSSTTP